MFDSNAILLYLAEKTRKFLPPDDPSNRGQLLSWLMFIASGVGPYSGQAAHFKAFAPEQLPYAINRYRSEASRHYGILDERLKDRQYLLGDDYTIVDMAAWAWGIMVPVLLDAAAWELLPNFKRLIDAVSARPAAVRVMAMQAQHKFKHELDSEARSALFPTSQH